MRFVSVPCRFKGWKLKNMTVKDEDSLVYSQRRVDIAEDEIKNRDRGLRAFNIINSTREVAPSLHSKINQSQEFIEKNKQMVKTQKDFTDIKITSSRLQSNMQNESNYQSTRRVVQSQLNDYLDKERVHNR